ncbi:MAG: L-aspartate oxidase [Gammaproteobacteria bacterium]
MNDSSQPLIVGGGIAGLVTALSFAPKPIRLLVRGRLGNEGSSLWAQGGIAAAVGPDDDPRRHSDDTQRAGCGLADLQVTERITQAGPWAIDYLATLGVPFDRSASGDLLLGLEGGHSRHRIVHAGGDATGRIIMETLIRRVRSTPSIEIIEGFEARVLEHDEEGILGVSAVGPGGASFFPSGRVVLATGGVGGLFPATTNPRGSRGQGLLMALLAGAPLIDMEFIQYHPTALDTGTQTLPLISEAVRGDGAILVDEKGNRFLAKAPQAELAPRDQVARAVWFEREEGHQVFLDARKQPGADFPVWFPSIYAVCLARGLDPRKDLLPICPAVHYHMGGIEVDERGQAAIPGLWAVGEVAATGFHGANRLASNSLLEAVVCGHAVARSLADAPIPHRTHKVSERQPIPSFESKAVSAILGRSMGVVRERMELEAALAQLAAEMKGGEQPMALLGWVWVFAALQRIESRGAHFRQDHPDLDRHFEKRQRVSLEDWWAHNPDGGMG